MARTDAGHTSSARPCSPRRHVRPREQGHARRGRPEDRVGGAVGPGYGRLQRLVGEHMPAGMGHADEDERLGRDERRPTYCAAFNRLFLPDTWTCEPTRPDSKVESIDAEMDTPPVAMMAPVSVASMV